MLDANFFIVQQRFDMNKTNNSAHTYMDIVHRFTDNAQKLQ